MRLCKHCGSAVDDDAIFCDKCGSKIEGIVESEPIVEKEPKSAVNTDAPPLEKAKPKEDFKSITNPPAKVKVKVKAQKPVVKVVPKKAAKPAHTENTENTSDLTTVGASEAQPPATADLQKVQPASVLSEEDKEKCKALLREAHCVLRGVDCAIDIDRATELYHLIIDIDPNNAEALVNLSDIYYDREDDEACIAYAKRAAKLGNTKGMENTGYYNLYLLKEPQTALNWLKLGAEAGDFNCVQLIYDAFEECYNENGLNRYVEYLERLASNDNASAMIQLYILYSVNDSLPPNKEKALKYINRAVELNSARAYATYAKDLFNGTKEFVPKNIPLAREYLEKAVSLGDEDAIWSLSVIYSLGLNGYPQDEDKEVELCERLVDIGDVLYYDAISSLGLSFYAKNIQTERARTFIEVSAAHNCTGSLNCLAGNYLHGYNNYEKDPQKAIEYYEKSADYGSMTAMYNLGRLYLDGANGSVPINTTKGIDWLSKAAENEYGPAAEEVGDYYYNGQFVEKDLKKARHNYEIAAKEGMTKAMFALGVMNEEGEGGPKLFKAAEYWYKKLDESGADENGIAKYNLGRLYLYKMGRYNEALPMLVEAAQAGNEDAMYCAGICYGNGWGTPVILQTAEVYLNHALQNGVQEAQNDLTTVRNLLASGAHVPQTAYPPRHTDDSGKQRTNPINTGKTSSPKKQAQPREYIYKDPGMDVKQAKKIVGFTIAFFVIGAFIALVINSGTYISGRSHLNFGVALLIAYAVSALPLSVIRLKGLRAKGNKAEIGAAGGYFAGGGSEGNGCTVASAFIIGRWLINWIICMVVLFYWFPKSIAAIVRNSNNKKVGG